MFPSRAATGVGVATLIVLATLAGPALADPVGRCSDYVQREGRTYWVFQAEADAKKKAEPPKKGPRP